jgi:CBS domain-containing protein
VARNDETIEEFALETALSEIVRFLSGRPPFDALELDELGEVAGQTEIEFHPAGGVILSEDGGPVTFLRVIYSGAVDVVHAGQLLDLLCPGDTFGHAAMLSGLPPGFEARAAEDTLCYRIPANVARPLLERIKTRELERGAGRTNRAVATLIRKPTVRCAPMTRIREVARRMVEEGATSAIIDLGSGRFGIVTDRDFRTRIVAAGMPVTSPVASLMSTPVFSVAPERPGAEVLLELLDRGIRHAPVVNERGELIGVVEDADLYAASSRSWFEARRSFAHARDLPELTTAAGRLPAVIVDVHGSRLRAPEVARVLSSLVDTLTVRALELAATPAPDPERVGWIAIGSHARRELTPASVARGVLLSAGEPPPGWLQATRAVLAAAGMAWEAALRRPEQWVDADDRDEPILTALIERRTLWGSLPVDAPDPGDGARARLLDVLRRRALACVPPTGFDGGGVLHAGGARSDRLDIRVTALKPIVELARWGGAAAGIVEGSTLDRLRAATAAGFIGEAEGLTLQDAFELVLELRIEHHVEQLAAGSRPDDRLDPAEISPLMRDHLRDVFRAVAAVQRRLRRQ